MIPILCRRAGWRHSPEEVEALKAAARQRLAAGQGELDLGLTLAEAAASGGPLEITSSRMGHLWGLFADEGVGRRRVGGWVGVEVFR